VAGPLLTVPVRSVAARAIERYSRSMAGERPFSVSSMARAAINAAPIASSAADRDRELEHSLGLLGRSGEQRGAGKASVTVGARQAARQGDRLRAARRARGWQAAPVEQAGHRLAEHSHRRLLIQAGAGRDSQGHVEPARGQAIGWVRGEHDPLGRHPREKLHHVDREEARSVIQGARVIGQA